MFTRTANSSQYFERANEYIEDIEAFFQDLWEDMKDALGSDENGTDDIHIPGQFSSAQYTFAEASDSETTEFQIMDIL